MSTRCRVAYRQKSGSGAGLAIQPMPYTQALSRSTSTSTSTSPISPVGSEMHRRSPHLRSSSSSSLGGTSEVASQYFAQVPLDGGISGKKEGSGKMLGSIYAQSPVHRSTASTSPSSLSVWGIPLKYIALVTLAIQNAALSIVMHYSRVSTPPSRAYSPASAVLINEVLKGFISVIVAFICSPILSNTPAKHHGSRIWSQALANVGCEVFSADAWKLSIPAFLYVVQNSLQFVAVSNLPVATFQVTYQMKILTTAAFSVALLRRRLSRSKWLALLFLAAGVGIVQIQSATRASPSARGHVMDPLKGFGAVTAACFTSGLAGVYFEMVLKGSKTDLWVRSIQLSLFSIVPALLPVLHQHGFGFHMYRGIFHNFGGWAWATVFIQTFGGLVTAVVIKYSDNIMKGFATSLSIVISFLASVVLFNFHITPAFGIGAVTVLAATWLYNQPDEVVQDLHDEKERLIGADQDQELDMQAEERDTVPEKVGGISLNETTPTPAPVKLSSLPSPVVHNEKSPRYPAALTMPSNFSFGNSSPRSPQNGLGSPTKTLSSVGSFIRNKTGSIGSLASITGGSGGSGLPSPSDTDTRHSRRKSSAASISGLLSAGLNSIKTISPSASRGADPSSNGGMGLNLGMAETGHFVRQSLSIPSSSSLHSVDGKAEVKN